MKMKIRILALMIAVFAFCSFSIFSQENRQDKKGSEVRAPVKDKSEIVRHYEEVSQLTTRDERRLWLSKRSSLQRSKTTNCFMSSEIIKLSKRL
jgi:hypothetical protein